MRNFCVPAVFVLSQLWYTNIGAQDFSNKGKDFWVAYGYHQSMYEPNPAVHNGQNMVLYFSSEKNAIVTVTIPGVGYTRTYNITANTTFVSEPIPKTGPEDARLTGPSVAPENKGIHITSNEPIIAYSHIYHETSSGAGLLYPVHTLSREYYSVNFTNISGAWNANCWFYVVAVDTGITTVEITPSAGVVGHTTGVPFTINLTQGQVYNVMGLFTNGTNPSGTDLTGSVVKSISTTNGKCKKIAVFSGTGRINIVCTPTPVASSDNYMVQALPKNAWGKKYLTASCLRYDIFNGNTNSFKQHNYYRICVQDPSTVVKLNGQIIEYPLINNFYYQVPATQLPQLIEADKPVMVAQYFTSRYSGCNSLTSQVTQDGDPETIYLSPLEQSIRKISWIACSTENIKPGKNYINVIIPNGGTAISSFRLDGNPVPDTNFLPHPQDPAYSYAVLNVSGIPPGTGPGISHTIQSDSGFNSMAYGFGVAESYGYNAGTNIKDLYQFVSLQNEYGQANAPATCKDAPFRLSVTFPYQPLQIKWLFSGLFADVTINSPVHDSTWTLNGRQLYRYTLPLLYTVPAPGNYPVKIIAQNPTPGQCSGEQEFEFDITVLEKPVADFNHVSNCFTNPVLFTDNSSTDGRPMIRWYWDFDDGNFSASYNPGHTFPAAGSYDVRYSIITDIGCLSDTITKTVFTGAAPVANFTTASPLCSGQDIVFTDASTVPAGLILVKWTWNFGDGSPDVIVPTNASQVHSYNNPGTYEITLLVESNSGCKSLIVRRTIIINGPPIAAFISPRACLLDLNAAFTDNSIVSPGNITAWEWNFGDPNATVANPNTSILQNPTHYFSVAGPYTSTLIVTSNAGCKDTAQNTFIINGANPTAGFIHQTPGAICSNQPVEIKDQSFVNPGSIIKVEIFWDVTDLSIKTTDNDPIVGEVYAHLYPVFSNPATRVYTIRYDVYSGANCAGSFTGTVTLSATPSLQFNTIPNICLDANPYQINQAFETSGMTGTGVFSGNGVSSSGLFTPAAAGEGSHTIRFTFTGNNGCTDFIENTIFVYPKIPVDAGPDKTVLEGNGVMLTPVVNFSVPVTFLWSPPTGLSNTGIATPLSSPPDDILYTFTVISDKGCRSSDQVLVKVLKPILIPNAFSPNGDGAHDRWEIKNLGPYPGSVIMIYNRYGQMINKIVNYSNPWDGRVNGKDVPVGTYYYIIEPRNGRAPLSGYVDVIR